MNDSMKNGLLKSALEREKPKLEVFFPPWKLGYNGGVLASYLENKLDSSHAQVFFKRFFLMKSEMGCAVLLNHIQSLTKFSFFC